MSNARSLPPKLDELRALCVDNPYDIICIVESWLSGDIGDTELSIPGFTVFRKDRNRHGGGIIVFVRSSLPCTILPFEPPTIPHIQLEFLPLCIEFCKHKFCISVFYRPPSSDLAYFDSFCNAVESLDIAKYSSFILLGDFNIDFCNPHHPMVTKLANFCNSLMLTQTVGEPTHTSPTGNQSLIDLVFLSNPQQLKHCYVAPPLGTSDHNCISLSVSQRGSSTRSTKKSPRTVWRYQCADFAKANELLDDVDWEELLTGDVDQMWQAWEHKFMSVMHRCIPTAQLSSKRNLPWINKTITKAIRARNLAFRRAKHSGREHHKDNYKQKRNKVTNMLKAAKAKFFKQLNPSNPKMFWRVVKLLTKQPSSIPVLRDSQQRAVHDDVEKATLLNDFFSSCFNDAQEPLDTSDYLELDQPDPGLCPDWLLCNEDEILEMLLSLDTTKSSGPDGISATMLKQTAASIAPGITEFLNTSIRTGKFPTAWKTSSVVPIPKGSDHTSVSNYRPISLLPILSKLLEKHIHGVISNHLSANSPIALQQWGFQTKKSSVTALADVLYNWAVALDKGLEVCAVFFDLQKAFDSVPHKSLMHKLRSVGLDAYILRWICSYLTHREQYVVLNGERSVSNNVTSGVPQGSVLGPLLFLVYINDSVRSTAFDGNCINLYADDMLLYRVINGSQDIRCVQQGVNNVGKWVEENHLKLNSNKCKLMVISKRRTKATSIPELYLYGKALERVHEYKYLGVLLTSNLSWTAHIDRTVAKARKLTGLLYRQFSKWSTPEALLKIYLSTIRPHLEYAAPIWSPEHTKDITMLENVQKFALRVCTKQWNSSYDDLIAFCNVPKLGQRRSLLSLGLLHKIINGDFTMPDAPVSPYVPTYSTRSAEANWYNVPFSRTNTLQSSFFPRTILVWNALPSSVTTTTSLASFKQQLLQHLTPY